MNKKIVLAILLLKIINTDAMQKDLNTQTIESLSQTLGLSYVQAHTAIQSNRHLFSDDERYNNALLVLSEVYKNTMNIYTQSPQEASQSLHQSIKFFEISIESIKKCVGDAPAQSFATNAASHLASSPSKTPSKRQFYKTAPYENKHEQHFNEELYKKAVTFFEDIAPSFPMPLMIYLNDEKHNRSTYLNQRLIIEMHKAYEEALYRCEGRNYNTALLEQSNIILLRLKDDMIIVCKDLIDTTNKIAEGIKKNDRQKINCCSKKRYHCTLKASQIINDLYTIYHKLSGTVIYN